MELLRFFINAGETKRFEKAGRLIEIIASDYELNIGLYDGNGSRTDSAVGALSGLFFTEPFSAFDVTSETAQSVVLMIANSGGSRRQPGVVQVVDSNKARVVAKAAYTVPFVTTPSGAQVGRAGVWLPVGSSHRAIVESVEFSTAVTAPFFIAQISTSPLNQTNSGKSKLIGDATLPQLLTFHDPQPGDSSIRLRKYTGVAGALYEPKSPLVLRPGSGLVVVCETLGQTFSGTVDFFEEPNV